MSTLEEILKLFENNKGKYFSGEDIAQKLNISRTAVWKYVKILKEKGYKIEGVTNKGYCLREENDILSLVGIKKYLDDPDYFNIEILESIDSTNKYLMNNEKAGLKQGTVVISKEQTKGKGRYNRSFYSPLNTGIYMSILLKPENFYAENIYKITACSALSICDTIEKLSHKKAKIKWVNDVYIKNKKVCGILTDGAVEMESGLLKYAVTGLGINLYKPQNGFPDEIKNIADSVFEKSENDMKNKFVATFLNIFFNYFKKFNEDEIMEEYTKRSFIIGKIVTIKSPSINGEVVVKGIDKKLRLIVETQNKDIFYLSSGDVSLSI